MTWIVANWDQIARYGLQHVWLSVPPIVAGTALSIPLGQLANRYRLSRGVLLSIGGILYAIPSLPLFVLLPSLLGTRILDPLNVEVALTIYALALMLRATADALASVDGQVTLSATAVGYGGWRRFWGVELPLAGPVILAGVRVVSASTVSLVTVGSLIGVNSLGFFFLDGYQRYFPTEIWVGIVGTVVIAVVFDLLLVLAGRLLMPWARPSRRAGRATATLLGVEAEPS
ncbi:ABC transporter permease [Gryllotalpicola sp.]|uniref:ABC transporter permease n=1 Tax=Gryllotalpicola sp. TaxID=1932787 RepID=UPI002620EB5E|nr:ABC transporter permease [Gryllotalpicola sp.]